MAGVTEPGSTPATPRKRRQPSPRVMRQINRIPRLILRSPAHRAISKKLLLLTFTGRRSGKRFTIPLGYVQPDERTVLVGTESPWSRNLRVPGGAPVTVRLRGRDRVGTAEVIDDEAGMTDAYRTMLTLDPGYGRFIDVRLGSDGQPVPEDIARARARGLVVVRIRLD